MAEGFQRDAAIFGTSEACVATYPSDMAIAMVALDAVVRTHGPRGARAIPLTELHRLPGDQPERDTVLEHGELITAVDLPPLAFATSSRYRKVRDRASYAFALVSVAAALDVADGIVRAPLACAEAEGARGARPKRLPRSGGRRAHDSRCPATRSGSAPAYRPHALISRGRAMSAMRTRAIGAALDRSRPDKVRASRVRLRTARRESAYLYLIRPRSPLDASAVRYPCRMAGKCVMRTRTRRGSRLPAPQAVIPVDEIVFRD
jgi:hypothetical protein